VDIAVIPPSDEIAVAHISGQKISIYDGHSGKYVRHFSTAASETRPGDTRPVDPSLPARLTADSLTAITADMHGHLLVCDVKGELQVFTTEGKLVCTRGDLGIKSSCAWAGTDYKYWKGLGWDHGSGGLAIADSDGQKVLLFNGNECTYYEGHYEHRDFVDTWQ
jgi:hypothetical protein